MISNNSRFALSRLCGNVFSHRGVEKWHLARLITLRIGFDSQPRNNKENAQKGVFFLSIKREIKSSDNFWKVRTKNYLLTEIVPLEEVEEKAVRMLFQSHDNCT